MNEIHKILVATTAHLRKEVAEKLPSQLCRMCGAVELHIDLYDDATAAWQPTFSRATGWMWFVSPIHVGPGDDHNTPVELRQLFAAARAAECCWLMLDADGDAIDGLEVFEW